MTKKIVIPPLVRFRLTAEQESQVADILAAQRTGQGYTMLILAGDWDFPKGEHFVTAHCRWLPKKKVDLIVKAMMKL